MATFPYFDNGRLTKEISFDGITYIVAYTTTPNGNPEFLELIEDGIVVAQSFYNYNTESAFFANLVEEEDLSANFWAYENLDDVIADLVSNYAYS